MAEQRTQPLPKPPDPKLEQGSDGLTEAMRELAEMVRLLLRELADWGNG